VEKRLLISDGVVTLTEIAQTVTLLTVCVTGAASAWGGAVIAWRWVETGSIHERRKTTERRKAPSMAFGFYRPDRGLFVLNERMSRRRAA
jgi:hypothetical protein